MLSKSPNAAHEAISAFQKRIKAETGEERSCVVVTQGKRGFDQFSLS
jgi:hypothetical protein